MKKDSEKKAPPTLRTQVSAEEKRLNREIIVNNEIILDDWKRTKWVDGKLVTEKVYEYKPTTDAAEYHGLDRVGNRYKHVKKEK
jgi:hypothetical protein